MRRKGLADGVSVETEALVETDTPKGSDPRGKMWLETTIEIVRRHRVVADDPVRVVGGKGRCIGLDERDKAVTFVSVVYRRDIHALRAPDPGLSPEQETILAAARAILEDWR